MKVRAQVASPDLGFSLSLSRAPKTVWSPLFEIAGNVAFFPSLDRQSALFLDTVKKTFKD